MTPAENRRLWLAIHRYTGLTMLVFVAIAAVTGCVLVLAKPLDAALNPDLFRRAAGAARVDPVAAVAALETARPELRVTNFPLHTGPRENLLVGIEPRDGKSLGYNQLFLDGRDGHVVGVRQSGPGWDRRHFVEGVFEFHYTLLAGNPGRWLMGVMALAWLLSNLVGAYVSFPLKGPFWANWKRAWQIRIKAPFARLMLDIHQATALWLLVGLTILAFTSVAMNFFSEAFTPIVQAVSPAKVSPFDTPAPARTSAFTGTLGFRRAIDEGVRTAKTRGLTWKPAATGYLADRDLYQVTFTASGVVNYSRLGPISYYLSGQDGRLVYEDNPYTDSAGRKVSRSLYPLHTGQVAGPFGEVVVFILGLATAEMCVTGAYLWLKRRGPRIAGRKALKASREQAS